MATVPLALNPPNNHKPYSGDMQIVAPGPPFALIPSYGLFGSCQPS